jgi:hypothetical protein
MTTSSSEQPVYLPEEALPAAHPYRHVSTLAVGSLVCGALSWLGAYFEWLLVLPLLGIGLGLAALTRIDRFPDELTGSTVAKLGMGLSAVLGVVCFGWHGYLYFAAAPPGYYLITYDMLKPLPGAAPDDPPPSARELEGKRVFIKGYMYPGRQTIGIERFTLVPSLTHCQFCMPQLKPTEMIDVKLVHGMKARFTNRRRGVGGIFHIRSPDDKEPGLLYQIQADYLK